MNESAAVRVIVSMQESQGKKSIAKAIAAAGLAIGKPEIAYRYLPVFVLHPTGF